jgi:hypothetical protein
MCPGLTSPGARMTPVAENSVVVSSFVSSPYLNLTKSASVRNRCISLYFLR